MAWESFSTWARALQLEGVAAQVAGLGRRRCTQLRIQRAAKKACGLAGPGHPGCRGGGAPAAGGGPSLAGSIEGDGEAEGSATNSNTVVRTRWDRASRRDFLCEYLRCTLAALWR
ncbi:hypothetical protein TraAM80_06197 [Trypanosoma rangeli]|uniref:Uncharacterized protein n=1 Tax=Trypanosoma rangeli TaxID=5698 RepID=A0A3R7RHY1_TRYRA|nr:uncharacterized protein TraAM80_06197 [Trypanosoma rangeli]RNF02963.1 hypothetical protein TraAM80_06197 [Trypanosoma rangeli]|eukprot:RNF02963.1 hypothetical protein TraAM80_06197 [Trypanosoma rangeli]